MTSFRLEYSIICIAFLLASCAAKKQYGAHFASPNNRKNSEYHRLKSTEKVIIKKFQEYEPKADKNIGTMNDSLRQVQDKTEVVSSDSVKNTSSHQGRFFLTRTHEIIPYDDPKLEVVPKSTIARFNKRNRFKRNTIPDSHTAGSLFILPLIAFFMPFSYLFAGIFFVLGGIMSISEYLKVRRLARKIKGRGLADVSISIYALLLGALMLLGINYLFYLRGFATL